MPVHEDHDFEQQMGSAITVIPRKCPFYFHTGGLCLVASSGGFRPVDDHVRFICRGIRYRDECERYRDRGAFGLLPIEQRAFRRVVKHLTGAFTGGPVKADAQFETVDLGLGGLRLISRTARKSGDCAEIVLLPEGAHPINARACVRWAAPQSSGRGVEMGLSFEPPLRGPQFDAFQALLWTDESA
jgi:hypothetical protein